MRRLLVPLTFVSLVLAQYEQASDGNAGSYGSPAKIFGEANERKAQEHLSGELLPPSGSSDPLAGYGREPPAPAENPGTEPLPPGPASPPAPVSEQPASPLSPGDAKAASTDDTYETKEAAKATVDSSAEPAAVAPQETTPTAEAATQPAAPEDGEAPASYATSAAPAEATDSYTNAAGSGVTEAVDAPAEVESSPAVAETTPVEQSVTEAPAASSTYAAPASEAPPILAEGGYESGAPPPPPEAGAMKPSVPEEGSTESTSSAPLATEAPKESYNAGSVAPETSPSPVAAETTAEASAQTPEAPPKEEGYAGEKASKAPEATTPQAEAETSPTPGSYATSAAPAEDAGSSPAAPAEEKAHGQSYEEAAPSGQESSAAGAGAESEATTTVPPSAKASVDEAGQPKEGGYAAGQEGQGRPAAEEKPAEGQTPETAQPKEGGYVEGQAVITTQTETTTAPAEAAQPMEEGYAGGVAGQTAQKTPAPVTPTEVYPSANTEQVATIKAATSPRSTEVEGSGNYVENAEGSGAAPPGEEIPPHLPIGESPPPSPPVESSSSGEVKNPAYTEAAGSKPSESGEHVVESGRVTEGSGYASAEKTESKGTADKSIETSGTPEEAKPEADGSKPEAGAYGEPAKHLEGDKNLDTGEDKVIKVKEDKDKYVTAPGERVSTPGVTLAPEASKTSSPTDWNAVSSTSDNPVTGTSTKITEPLPNSQFSTDTTNKEVEPSGYEMGNGRRKEENRDERSFRACHQHAGSSSNQWGFFSFMRDGNILEPEEAVGYNGIPKDDVKKDLPQQPQQDLNRNSGEVKFLRRQNSSAEKKYKWTPYRFDCSTEEDDKGLLCNEWAQAGLCEQHRPTMFLFCRKTCLCTGPRKKRSVFFL